eukprot:gene14485-30839_t
MTAKETVVLLISLLVLKSLAFNGRYLQPLQPNIYFGKNSKIPTTSFSTVLRSTQRTKISALTSGPTEIEVSSTDEKSQKNVKLVVGGLCLSAIAIGSYLAATGGLSGININDLLQHAVNKIESLGPYGFLYFSAVYIIAEVLAIPAIPLTASSGYLFGLVPGVCTVLVSATIAASISFFIGRTLLRGWAKKLVE